MKFRITKKHILYIVLPSIAGVALGLGFFAGTALVRPTLIAVTRGLADTAMRVDVLERRLAVISGDTDVLRTTVVQSDAELKKEQTRFQEKLGTLSGNLDVQETRIEDIVKTTDVSGLVTQWSPLVYRITCSFDVVDEGGAEVSKGSALLEQTASGVRFITNRHVLESEGARLIRCTLSAPNTDVTITAMASDVHISKDIDFGYGYIDEPLAAMSASQKCTQKPNIGDTVLILGYPAIGAKESVTATEGIVSGFDEEYYTTSAKIERGNSGGAAIDIEQNCFLGLPTLVFSGKIESIARILPASSF